MGIQNIIARLRNDLKRACQQQAEAEKVLKQQQEHMFETEALLARSRALQADLLAAIATLEPAPGKMTVTWMAGAPSEPMSITLPLHHPLAGMPAGTDTAVKLGDPIAQGNIAQGKVDRGTGRTTQQVMALQPDDIFVVNTQDMAEHVMHLAAKHGPSLGSLNLYVIGKDDSGAILTGLNKKRIIVDHACELSLPCWTIIQQHNRKSWS